MELLRYETELWSKGLTHIAGVDEAGRGPLAGPIVIAAVILKKEHLHNNPNLKAELLENYSLINDSKKLTEKKREMLYDFILEHALTFHLEEIPANKIDEWGISRSNQIGFFNAVKSLSITAEHVLTDHFPIRAFSENLQTNITKGDSNSMTIAAASILAKVHRDRKMLEFHEEYPKYGFDKHKGYGTRFHRDQIVKLGPCKIHRRTFEPTKSLVGR